MSETTLKRLNKEREVEILQAFADYRELTGLDGLRITYRDEGGRVYYQVDDETGRGDGSGEWTEVID